MGPNKAGICLSNASVRVIGRLGSMSSPPKEKTETKGGHLPAGKAPSLVVVVQLLTRCFLDPEAFGLCSLPSQESHDDE